MKVFKARLAEILGLGLFNLVCWLTMHSANLLVGSCVIVLFILLLALIYDRSKRLQQKQNLTDGHSGFSLLLLLILYVESLIYITTTDLFLLLPIVVLMLPYFMYQYITAILLAEIKTP